MAARFTATPRPAAPAARVTRAVPQAVNVLDDGKRRQMVMELKVLHRASCPQLVAFYGAFYDDHQIYIALEYLDGGSLQDVLRRAKVRRPHLPPRSTASVTVCTSSGAVLRRDKADKTRTSHRAPLRASMHQQHGSACVHPLMLMLHA